MKQAEQCSYLLYISNAMSPPDEFISENDGAVVQAWLAVHNRPHSCPSLTGKDVPLLLGLVMDIED
jgi:hypothetical protein